MDDDVLDVRGAAALLGVGKNTLYEAAGRGQIPHRKVGRQLRFSRAALLAWLGDPGRATVGTWSSQRRGSE
jgi:excisionase family DNA binding protein